MKQDVRSGFTIVELLIVIVVIGILAAITIVAFTGVQSRARDAQRVVAMNSVQKKLEEFRAINGYYPNASQINDSSYRTNTLGLPLMPGGANIGYCWSSNVDHYCYVPGPSTNGGPDCNAPSQCSWYTLSYRKESDSGTQIRIASPN